ncbi:MAG: insulinase family protein, partial [Myxococcales bacterium]|nr:insulinase family protein [Myxococcales bacterium]
MLVLGLAAVAGEPDTEAFCYASGLRVAHERIHGRAVASALTRVTAGSRTEPEGLDGMAHLVEHLWFKSSFGDGSVRQALDAMGARFNAQTDRDAIVYETTVPAGSFDDLLALEAHRARQGPLVGLPDEELERERAIVRSERLFRDAGGMRGVYETLLADLLAGSAYGHSVSGTDATLDAIDLQAAREWAERHHHAGSQSMLLVSPNPHAKVREAVEAHFGNLASESVPCGPRQEPASQAVPAAWTARTVTLPVPERTLAFAWALPPTGPVPLALDGAVASTLAREMDESATCSAIGLDAVAVVVCRMPWPEGDAPLDDLEGLEKVWRIDGPAMLGEGGPAFARSHVATRITRLDDVSAEGSDRLLEKLTMFHHTGRTDHLAGLELAVQKMSPDWFRGHLNKVMPAGQRVALVVEPNGEANAGLAVHPERRSRPAPSVLPEDLAALPKPEVHTTTLPNGLALTAIRLQGLPVTRVALVLPGGTLRADDPAVDVAARARLQSIDRPLQDLAAARKATWQDGDDGWDWRVASTDTTAPYRLLAKRLEQVGMRGGPLAEL